MAVEFERGIEESARVFVVQFRVDVVAVIVVVVVVVAAGTTLTVTLSR